VADALAGVVTVTSTVPRLDAADAVAVFCVALLTMNEAEGGAEVHDPCRVVRTAPSWPA
jgi:hypothetical protein